MGGGFGPSSGRFVEACESSDVRGRIKTKSMPPAVGVLAFAAAFFGFVFGVMFLYEDKETLGAVLLILAVILVALPVIWTIRTRR